MKAVSSLSVNDLRNVEYNSFLFLTKRIKTRYVLMYKVSLTFVTDYYLSSSFLKS